MLIPSIDLMGGHAVQLIGGESTNKVIDAGDPAPLAARFGRVGEVAVIDLDAALSQGSNAETIRGLLRTAPCRVGGGIRSLDAAVRWLDAGAEKIILGTMAQPELLRQLPRERVIAALDARDGKVVIEGWTKDTGAAILARVAELRDHVGGFLVTFVEREGRLAGTDLQLAKTIVEAAGVARVTIAGGVTTADEIRDLDAMGADAQVGMALYSGKLPLVDAVLAPIISDRADGLIPTVVVDQHGIALGLVYSDRESVEAALERGVGAYHSRSRGLWIKGATSGATQSLLRVDTDCDRDALRFTVEQQAPGFCHLDRWSCFGPDFGLPALERTLHARKANAPTGSYTARLFDDPTLLAGKLTEETQELVEATAHAEVVHEAADVLFFTLARMTAAGVTLAEVEAELAARAKRHTRRE